MQLSEVVWTLALHRLKKWKKLFLKGLYQIRSGLLPLRSVFAAMPVNFAAALILLIELVSIYEHMHDALVIHFVSNVWPEFRVEWI